MQVRRCIGSGKAKRCSAYGAWKRPAAAKPGSKLPAGATPGSGAPGAGAPTTPGPGTTPTGLGGLVPTIGGCPVFPADHAFNQDVSGLPLDPRSDAYIQSIGAGGRVHPDFGAADLGQGPGGFGIPYRVVPKSQPLVDVKLGIYKAESDGVDGAGNGKYPIPLDTPVEGGPNSTGDRHVLVVRQEECKLYELGNAYPQADHWKASGGAIWDLATGLRPPTAQPGWTSVDAAGLPVLPGLVRYDEVAAGEIRHAVRFTVSGTQRGYIAPAQPLRLATHRPEPPPMGLRLRMRANFDLSRVQGPVAGHRDGAEEVRHDRRRQRLGLVHQRRRGPPLGRRGPQPAQDGPGQRLRGREDRRDHPRLLGRGLGLTPWRRSPRPSCGPAAR